MLGDLLCKLGLHRSKRMFGYYNRYYECTHCAKRTVRIGSGGYQPINTEWLNGGKEVNIPSNPPKFL